MVYSLSMWEALVKLGASASDVVRACEDLTEAECEEQLRQAQGRIDQMKRVEQERMRRAAEVFETPAQIAVANALGSRFGRRVGR